MTRNKLTLQEFKYKFKTYLLNENTNRWMAIITNEEYKI